MQRVGSTGYWRAKLHPASLQSVTNAHCESDRYSYSYCNCDSNSDGYGYCYSHGNGYTDADIHAEACSNAEAPPDPAASPVIG